MRTLQKLQLMCNSSCNFLGFTLDLHNSILIDNLKQSNENLVDCGIQVFATLLTHYSLEKFTPLRGKLVKFKDVPGGYAYEAAFNKRAIQPIEEIFGEQPEKLIKVGRLLGGKPVSLGDASVEILALKGIPLTYILWGAEEFPATANILFDESASNYLPTEDLAVLGEITTLRLIEVYNTI
jgi:hypothetical protein